GQALRELLPSLLIAGLAARYPLKALFGRARPPEATVRARLLGRSYRPGFPSGDATCAFAGAWILSTVWPRGAALFLGLATGLSALRVYIGAHYPSDVAAGAVVGVGLAELVRRAVPLI
ncbi:MAG TPA: phosphatase PAP2 family protein, partial [Chloroflexota bacterium]|nr:phosphatase PAP2 family protein [Chloroflexota bacterium]